MKRLAYAIALVLFLVAGCQQRHLLADYRPLVKAGVFSGTIEQLKTLNVSEAEMAQFLKLKNANVSDDMCIALISAAHDHQHPFNSADSVLNLQGARYPDSDILAFAHANQLDTIAPEAVMLHLIGLSNATVQTILDRHMKGLPTMGTAEIGRLKNIGLTEKQDSRAHRKRNDRRSREQGSRCSRSRPQPLPYRFCESPRPPPPLARKSWSLRERFRVAAISA